MGVLPLVALPWYDKQWPGALSPCAPHIMKTCQGSSQDGASWVFLEVGPFIWSQIFTKHLIYAKYCWRLQKWTRMSPYPLGGQTNETDYCKGQQSAIIKTEADKPHQWLGKSWLSIKEIRTSLIEEMALKDK